MRLIQCISRETGIIKHSKISEYRFRRILKGFSLDFTATHTARNTRENAIVFGLFQRNGCIYTEMVPITLKKVLIEVVRGRIDPDSVPHLDGWRAYDGVVDLGCKRHLRVRALRDKLEIEASPINRIESFWAYTKHRLAKFKGLRKETFYFHLKETEFPFNHRRDRLYKLLMTILRNNPI